MLNRRAKQMCRVKNQPFTEQKHASKLTRLKNRPLTVLSRNNKADLERLPTPVNTLTKRATEHMLLPRVQMQARNSRQVHRIITC